MEQHFTRERQVKKMAQYVDFMEPVSADDWSMPQGRVDCHAVAQSFLEWAQELADQGRDRMAEKAITLAYAVLDIGLDCGGLTHPTSLN